MVLNKTIMFNTITTTMKPLCFVLMPFGVKTDGNKKEIDFDKVYQTFIRPAIVLAGLEPVRADEEKSGGFIHKPMYERLIFCEFAVADLSFANANVFYELGIRHALKPFTTVSIFDIATKIPFDTAPLRTFPYSYEDGEVKDLSYKIASLADIIKSNLNAQNALQDSPIAQLITGYQFPDLQYLQNHEDSFTEEVQRTNTVKDALSDLAKEWKALDKSKKGVSEEDRREIDVKQSEIVEKLKAIETEQGDGLKYNYDLLYVFLETYKSINSFQPVTRLLSPLVKSALKDNIYIRQQLALAYNKIKEREAAIEILEQIIAQYGPDPETNGLLGSVYKGLMDDNAESFMVPEYCRQAIEAYLQGFESDPRDFYPGVNALTLMYFSGIQSDKFQEYYPLVSFAVERQGKQKSKDYWLQATGFELAVLKLDEEKAKKYFLKALTCMPDKWQLETTYDNLVKIHTKAKSERGEEAVTWIWEILKIMEQQMK